jgi:hypothetical protein
MAYLDNSVITVEAIITKKGRQKLASGQLLDITKFALGDDGIDYSLYNATHKLGPSFYDSAILSLPITEASSDENFALQNKLVTLPKATIQIPVVTLTQTKIDITQKDSGVLLTPRTSPDGNKNGGYTMILPDQRAGRLTVSKGAITTAAMPVFLGEGVRTTAQIISGLEFIFIPNPNLAIDVSTTITVYGNETGGSQTIPLNVTYKI